MLDGRRDINTRLGLVYLIQLYLSGTLLLIPNAEIAACTIYDLDFKQDLQLSKAKGLYNNYCNK
jgi:hypothetical protein